MHAPEPEDSVFARIAAEHARTSRIAQGLPPTVENPEVYRKLAALCETVNPRTEEK
jgi:hypothetical protein